MAVLAGDRPYTLPSDPPLLSALFSRPLFAVIWLAVRLYLGWQWLEAGLHKIENPAWMSTGAALKGFWANAIALPAQGKPPITYDWYRVFLSELLAGGHYTWFAKLIVLGEITIGVALIVGAFVGVAALLGAFMNLNFMLAGSASTNPVLFTLAILLVLAWKTAGYRGLDRWLLPKLRTPWEWGMRTAHLRTSPRARADEEKREKDETGERGKGRPTGLFPVLPFSLYPFSALPFPIMSRK